MTDTETTTEPTEAELSERLAALREQKREACEAEIGPLMKRHGCSLHVRVEASPDLKTSVSIHAESGSNGAAGGEALNDLLESAGCTLEAETSISSLTGRSDRIHVRLKS